MARRALLLALALTVGGAGCGGSDGGGAEPAAPPQMPGARAPGASIAQQNGCLACHTFGSAGRDAPGNDLTRVGARLSRAEIERALTTDPPEGMQSYEHLSGGDLRALVDYLASLR